MKTTITFETASTDELKRVIAALPSASDLQGAVLYDATPLPAAGSKAELRQAIKDKNFWRVQAVKFAQRIKRLERRKKR